MTIEKRVFALTAEHLGVAADGLSLATKYTEELGADSLDMVELAMAFEEEFGVEMPDDVASKLETIGDAVEYIKEHGGE